MRRRIKMKVIVEVEIQDYNFETGTYSESSITHSDLLENLLVGFSSDGDEEVEFIAYDLQTEDTCPVIREVTIPKF